MSEKIKKDGTAQRDGEVSRAPRGNLGVPEVVPGTQAQMYCLNVETQKTAFEYRKALMRLGKPFDLARVDQNEGKDLAEPAALTGDVKHEPCLGAGSSLPPRAVGVASGPWPKTVDKTVKREGLAEYFDYDWDGAVESLIDIRPPAGNGIHDGSIVRCDLPVATTRRGYMCLARTLLDRVNGSKLDVRHECLLAALLAFAQECAVDPELESAGVPLDNVMNLISKSCDMAAGDYRDDSSRLTRLFGELETGMEVPSLRSTSLARSERKVGGVWLAMCERADGARGLDGSQSMALSLYYEYRRLERMLPGCREACMIKRRMAFYLPLTGGRTRGAYYTKGEQEARKARNKAAAPQCNIDPHAVAGVGFDLLERLQIEGLKRCIKDDRVSERKRARLKSKLKAITEMAEGRMHVDVEGEGANGGPGLAAGGSGSNARREPWDVAGPNARNEKWNGEDQ